MSEPTPKAQSFLDETIKHLTGHDATPRDRTMAMIILVVIGFIVALACASPVPAH